MTDANYLSGDKVTENDWCVIKIVDIHCNIEHLI